MKGNFRDLLRKFCLEGSILGLKYFYIYPDRISRCFWAVTLLCITYLACLLTYLLYNRFEEMPTRITIENQYEPLNDVPHPAITICSPNQITISSMKHFNRTLVDGNVSLNLEETLPQLLGFYSSLVISNPTALKNLQTLIHLNRYTVPEVMNSLPQRCDNFLKMCIFKRKLYPNCRGLFRPILTTHGLCCVFNSIYYFKDQRRNEKDKNVIIRKLESATGHANALVVLCDYNPHDAVDGTIINAGAVRVMFNDVNEFPSDDEMKLVPPHTESFHIMRATYTYCSEDVQRLASWSRECLFKDEKRLRFFQDYHNSDCDLLCLVLAVENACHCLLLHVPYLSVEHACNVTSISCILKVKRHMHKWIPSGRCDCPRDCDFHRFRSDLTVGNLNALPYLVNNPFSNMPINRSTAVMNFIFPRPAHVKQKQETVMSLITLTSNLGGVFGLCLGCSAISIVEILFYIYIFLRNYIRAYLRR